MPTIRLTAAHRLDLDKQRILGVLEARLPREGLDQAQLRAFIRALGLDYTDQELVAIRDGLVADGLIEVVP